MGKQSPSKLLTSFFTLTVLLLGDAVDVDTEPTDDYPRQVSGVLTINNSYGAGKWGGHDFCPDGSFVHGIVIRLQSKGSIDDTAVNAIKLFCRALNQTSDNYYVISSRSTRGHWLDPQSCMEGYVTSFRARVRPKGGMFVDNTAVQDFQATCSGGQVLRGVPVDKQFRSGQWSMDAKCPDKSAVCGLKTRIQNNLLDAVALSDAVLYCCPLHT
jgi:hypothetical protein